MDIDKRLEAWRRFISENFIFSRAQVAAAVFLLALIVGGALIIAGRRRTQPVTAVLKTPPPAKKKMTRPPMVVVHVAGRVKAPGVYKLPADGRVTDALKAAGGALTGADLDALNLAAKLHDAEKIMVPARGGATTATAVSGAPANDGKVALNTAGSDQLQTLDGVGPVLARRIVDYRRRHGPFTHISQLRQVKGIGAKKYAGMKEQVTLY